MTRKLPEASKIKVIATGKYFNFKLKRNNIKKD